MLLYGFDSDGTSDGKQLIIISSVAVESEFVAPPACELCAFWLTHLIVFQDFMSKYFGFRISDETFCFNVYGDYIFFRIFRF